MTVKHQTLLKKLRKNEISGMEFCEARSIAMDKHLIKVAKQILPEDIALIATGGYGRAELCPHSDIDILFLVPKKASKSLEDSIEKMLYEFWDSGIKVGYAVRTIGQCLSVMDNDPKVVTSLMDGRLVYGNQPLFDELQTTLENNKSARKTSQFIKAKLHERDERHKRYQDTRYVLEPNIKDGKGGLRDYQTLFWITQQAYDAKTPTALAQKDILSRKEKNRFEKAHHFLLTVRCQMHDIANRPEERLHFDIQLELASRLGYTHRNTAKAVERFMKHYFLVTRDIGDMTRIICAAIEEEEIKKTKLIKAAPKSVKGFEVHKNRLNFRPKQNLTKNPSHIMRFFRAIQETGYDVHPEALRTLSKNIDLIDHTFIQDKKNNALFLDILTGEKNAALTLRRMNEAGILERFIPDFRKIIALMQFDRYHHFTVDEHILRAIDILHKIDNGDLREDAGLASAIMPTLKNKRVLYVAMLLHDICKGQKGDHSMLGANLALTLCPRLGLDDDETRIVSWLVFDHLFMADTAFKHDLEDPQTLENFLFRIHGIERLKLLTVLTTADIMAVGPGMWTGWKDKLIQELYYLTEARMTGKHPLISTTALSGIPYDLEEEETRIDIAQDYEKNATIVSIYTQDKPGLFSTLAGALSMAGTNIIEARINTRDDGFVADIFTVQNLSHKQITKPHRLEKIKTSIIKAISEDIDFNKHIKATAPKIKKRDLAFEIPKGVLIKKKASKRFTVIETYGRDRHGLLFDLSNIIGQHSLNIVSAKINTLGLKAVDVFYIKTEKGSKITDEKRLKSLQKDLLKTLSV